jgi:hypothetical protein
MSSFSVDANLITTLNNVSIQMNRYLSILIFVFGISGNILNIVIFLHRTLRSNSCASLFLVTSIVNIICIVSGLTSRMLSGWAADLTNTIGWLCKMRVFIVWITRTFFMWTVMLATVDRWLMSSGNVHYRQMSTLKNAHRGMFVILLVAVLINVDLLYCFEPNQINTPLKCYSKTELCRYITDFTFAFIIYTIPLCLMIVFGLLTVRHIHQAQHRRIQPISAVGIITSAVPATQFTNSRSSQVKKIIDRRLLKMHLIQVIVLTIFSLPVAIQKLYSTLTADDYKSPLQTSVDNLMYNIAVLLNFASSGLPFYIFTLCGGSTFRNAFWDTMKNINRCVRHQEM